MVEAGAQWEFNQFLPAFFLPTKHITDVQNVFPRESKIPGDHKKNAVTFQKDIDSFVQ